MTQFIREYLLAVQFFTRIPITGRLAGWVGYSPEMLRASAAHFPGVGVLVGAIAASVYGLLMALLPDAAMRAGQNSAEPWGAIYPYLAANPPLRWCRPANRPEARCAPHAAQHLSAQALQPGR